MNNLLDSAIAAAGGVGRLADALGVRQNVVSNWRARGLPRPWELALTLKYGPAPQTPAKTPSPAQPEAA